MAEETTMTNIEIRDFATVQGVTDADYVVLSLSGGTSGKIAVGKFKSNISNETVPSIKDGIWWIGTSDTGVSAEGRTPQFRKGELGIEYKYADEDDSSWRLLVSFEDVIFSFDELTEEQRDSITLHFEDLTDEEIAELQKPVLDLIPSIEKATNDALDAADAAKETADHPTYIGEDYYVYKWNSEEKVYERTDIYVKGESEDLSQFYTKQESDLRYYTKEETDSVYQSVIMGSVTTDPASILE